MPVFRVTPNSNDIWGSVMTKCATIFREAKLLILSIILIQRTSSNFLVITKNGNINKDWISSPDQQMSYIGPITQQAESLKWSFKSSQETQTSCLLCVLGSPPREWKSDRTVALLEEEACRKQNVEQMERQIGFWWWIPSWFSHHSTNLDSYSILNYFK